MSEEVFPDGVMGVTTVGILRGILFGQDSAVCFFGIFPNIVVRDEAAGVLVRWFNFLDIYDGAEFVHAEKFPGTAVVIGLPSHIEDMRKPEIAVLWGD